MKKLFRRSLSVVLTMTMLSSMMSVAIISVDAITETKKELLAPTTTAASSTGKTYSLDEIYTDYLYSHTEKSSEKTDEEPITNTVANANDDKTYADFNFSQVSSSDSTTSGTTKTMQEQAQDLLDDESTDNPLSGYTFVRPEELLIGQINKDNQHEGEIRAIDNVDIPINQLAGIDSLKNAGDTISLSETKEGQAHNAIGIDYNGDGTDELAFFSLYADDKGRASVRTYRRSDSGSTLSWTQVSDQYIQISDNNKLLDIETQQSRGYTAMTAGDFDNDGKEELACYFPCANNGNGEPFVGIIDIDKDGNFNINNMKKIYLSSIRSDLNDLQSGKDSFESWYMPIVALSTTSIRANGAEDTSKSYDDLVINVSIPRVYYDNNDNMNSCIAIYSYNGSGYTNKFQSDLRYDTIRMLSTNSVDADLNGDGYNELVVAGMQEYGLSGDTDTDTISTSENLVQLIYWDGSNYKFVWDTPVKVTASEQVKVDWNAQEPIAITAGRYNPNTPVTMDYLCVQGVVLSCQNSKVYGVEKVAPEDTDANKAVIDTLPYKEKELFKDASFNKEYKADIQTLCSAKDNAFINTATSGMFYVNGQTETIALLTGDERDGHEDDISYDIILLSCDANGNWQTKVYDDYIHYKDEDDEGTYMSMCFVDCDKDSMYYIYRGKTVGYSSPTLYSVVQAPPFYKENNSAAVSYTVTHGTKTGVRQTWGVGGSIGVGYGNKLVSASIGVAARYIGTKVDATSYSKSTTLNLYTDQDYAISLVIPIVISTYDVWIPDGNNGQGELDEMVTTQNLDPVFAALPISEYNRLADQLTDEDQKNAAPVIDNLPASSSGDPYGYNSTSDALKEAMSINQNDESKIQETKVMVNTDTKSKSNSVGVTESSEKTEGVSVAFETNIKIAMVSVKFSADYSYSNISSDSEGVSFSVTYNALAKSNTASINPDSSSHYEKYKDTNGNLIESNIVHYQPADYIYYANAVAYPSDKLTKDIDEEDSEYKRNSVYLLSYYTDNFGGKPPELPEYFGVQSVSEKDDGTYSVTLAWKNTVRNSERKPDAYNIYVKSLNADTVELVNKEGPIDFNDNNFIMTYEVDGLKNTSNDYVFYIAAANTKTSKGDNNNIVLDAYESILSTPVTANIDELLDTDGIVITKQPKNCYVKNTGDEAFFSVEAYDSKGETENLYYHWQTYNSKSQKWVDVTNNKSFDSKTYIFDTTEDSFGKPIRCLVTKNVSSAENYTATTNVVTVTRNHTHNYDENGFCTYCDQYQPAEYNSETGNYEIGNAGQLYWFASLVNGDRTHADFDSQNTAANAVLVKDIVVNDGDMSELASTQSYALRKWTPIGTSDNSYTGQFDGQRHTISGLYFSDKNTDNVGLIGYTRGGADIYNVGIVNSYFEGKNCVGAIIGRNNNSGVTVQRCFSEATVIGNEGVGGIIGSTYGGKIIDCYNAGSVTGSKYVGSIRGRNTYNNSGTGAINNCFNVGKVIGTGSSNIGGIRGDGNGTISNCYCISTELTDTAATTKTVDEFKSGEVAYLLNHEVTNGTQVWYQNIDNGKTPDDYPKFDGGTVYYLEYKDSYSNTYSEGLDEFDRDENGNFIIKTYDDLVKLSELVRSNYKDYGSQNYILENNIKAPDDSVWTHGIGCVPENKPFNGTFNGNGYCIIGLNVNSSEYGGLFEVIGENGTVKDLFVFDCDFMSSSKVAGGIAAVNKGTLDHCVSGVNLTTGVIVFPNITIDASALNSNIKGDSSGGIVGENSGTITGCHNSAVVSGTQCGGIASVNTGRIYGCANSIRIGTSSSTISGGLVGKNGGTIESSYNSVTVNGKSENSKGSIAGINGYDGLTPTVKNVFCITSDSLNAVGTDSTHIPDNTNTSMSKTSDFQNDDFTDKMNAVCDDTVKWVRNDHLNKSLPTIKGNFLKPLSKSAGNNITVQGSMHKDLNIRYSAYNENNEEYALLTSSIKDKILKAYSVSLTDNDGNYIPAELWCQSSCKISVPVDKDNIQLAGIDFDGNVTYYKPDSVENGIAVFTVSYPMSFAIVETAENNNANPDKPSDDNTTVPTGETTYIAVYLLIAIISLAVIFIVKRRKRIG